MLQPAIQIRFNKTQLDWLAQIRATEGTPIGEQIRRMVDREISVTEAKARVQDMVNDGRMHLPPPLPVVNHGHRLGDELKPKPIPSAMQAHKPPARVKVRKR